MPNLPEIRRALLVIIAATLVIRQEARAQTELVQNPGFEQPGNPAPVNWVRDMVQTGKKGELILDSSTMHSGKVSLKLVPNSHNNGDHPLAVAQIIPGGAYRGKKLDFSVFAQAQGGATAVFAVFSFIGSRPQNLVSVTQASGAGWGEQHGVYQVPNDGNVQIVIACSASGKSGAVWFDDVSLKAAGDSPASAPAVAPVAPAVGQPPSAGALQAAIEVDAGNVIRDIPRTLYGANLEWVWNAYGLWLERDRKPDPTLVRLTQEGGVSLIRFPGGMYADFYHWRDCTGPLDKRPAVLHQAGSSDKSPCNFGTDEAMAFAKSVNAELLITVNAGTGTAQEAADWVRYANRNGLNVRYWEIGNEIYINDHSAAQNAITMAPDKYAAKARQFAQAMRAADSRIKIGAIGGANQGKYKFVAYPDWDKTVLQTAGDQIDFLAVHNAYSPVNVSNSDDLRQVYQAMFAGPVRIAQNLRTLEQEIARYAPARAGQISIAVTEWGPLFQVTQSGSYVEHARTLGSALFAASAMKVFLESPKTQIANFHSLSDLNIMGWIGTRNTSFPPQPDWYPTARYYAFEMFTKHFGDRVVKSSAAGPQFNSAARGAEEATQGVPYLDVIASVSADGKKLYLLAINRHFDSDIGGTITLRGFTPRATGTAWNLNGTSIDANTGTGPMRIPGQKWARQEEDGRNGRFSKGSASEVGLVSSVLKGLGGKFSYRFPAHSVTSLVLERQ